tara:strand:- start:54 stop:662 length:609 start_codon:yes stop_codon:yes gene_type:complete
MKNLLVIIFLGLLFSIKAYSASITEELSKLNDLYKSGALTEEEFSKAKSILLNESGEKIIIDAELIKALINESIAEGEEILKSNNDNSEDNKNLNNSVLTLSEEDALKAQIFGCWSIPLGLPYNENLLVRIKLELKPDGTISKIEILDHDRMNQPGQGFYKVLVESALRAIKLCEPLKVPIGDYERWKELYLNFDAREMLGG